MSCLGESGGVSRQVVVVTDTNLRVSRRTMACYADYFVDFVILDDKT